MGLTPSTLFSPSSSLPKLCGCIANIFRRRNKFMTARTTLLSVLLLGASWVVAQNTAPGSTSPSGSTSSQGTSSTQTSSPNQTDTNANQGSYGQSTTSPNTQSGATPSPSRQPGSTPGRIYSDQSGGNPGTNAGDNSIRGCLSGSAASGNYALKDSQTDATYTLTGNTDALRTNVGEQVEITGQPMGGASASANTSPNGTSASSSATGASSPSDQAGATSNRTGTAGSMDAGNNTSTAAGTNSFQVSNVTKIADHCSTSGRGPTAPLGSRVLMAYNAAPQTGTTTSPTAMSPGQTTPSTSQMPGTAPNTTQTPDINSQGAQTTPGTVPPNGTTPPSNTAPTTSTPPPQR